MNTKKYFSILLMLLTLACSKECLAFNENYPPFAVKTWKDRVLKVLPVIESPKGEFKDGKLTISCYPTGQEYGTRINIHYNNKSVEEINFPISKDDLSIFEDIYYVDIDKNDLPDIIIRTTNLGSGLGTFDNRVIMLLQTEPGHFRRINFSTFYFDTQDFVDLKGDGRYELLMLSLAELKGTDSKLRSFWVYTPYEIKDCNLVIDRHTYANFPKFVWYTKNPNSIPTDKLSRKQKEDYIKTLPRAIKSHPL